MTALRRASWARWLAALALLLALAGRLQVSLAESRSPRDPAAFLARRAAAIEGRALRLQQRAAAAARTVAALAETHGVLSGDRTKLSQLFLRLEQLRAADAPEPPALAPPPDRLCNDRSRRASTPERGTESRSEERRCDHVVGVRAQARQLAHRLPGTEWV